ncbi:unnamed protein product [Zymoseptoria tritici ST99CH_1A5]|uniref:Protein Zds1 C-terminal domain-containing protein n=3 Tax=Zymoseptoria tritici TaxID=1047171 RepID=A0A1X7RQ72_ZYMT9|nr:unnamed protein product [Zymoseptoria tritici ST99CH_3D7]SMR50539.1 unnamed protein product [Zymoseptoria tritici ST99CH_1E4]SMR51482.1 unnamed protein product [Zymoseptoria tritici ST99CH_3D1]SMY23239.1 unnamed protein product [Zymoseptoria tritici ST99CH_1A5]
MAAPSPGSSRSRQEELEKRYAQNLATRKHSHSPQLSISDDSHHVTEVFGSFYEDTTMNPRNRPLSYVPGASEAVMASRQQRRHATLLEANGNIVGVASPSLSSETASTSRPPLAPTHSNEKVPSPSDASSPKLSQRMGSWGAENVNGQSSPTTPSPSLSRQSSTHDTAVQPFPLNDIDYESSPAAVAQELSNLQAIRRMSMNVDTADPDLPSFSSSFPSVAPTKSDDEDDPSQLFWVPARLHPELAPKEFKTFIEDRVDRIRRRSGGEDSLSPDSLERSGSGSSLRRKKSMLSHTIDTKGNYEDGADRLERKRSSRGAYHSGSAAMSNLSDLEELVNDPAHMMRRMSLDQAARQSLESNDRSSSEDVPILPPVGTLKRSTRTTYRRGSLKKGERVPYSKRAQQRYAETDPDRPPPPLPKSPDSEEPSPGIIRVQTEPTPPPSDVHENFSRPGSQRRKLGGESRSSENLQANQRPDTIPRIEEDQHDDIPEAEVPTSQPPKQFHSRIASPGRTSAQLPGYNNTNPLPNIVETLPDGTRVPAGSLGQSLPERKSSHEVPRQYQRGGAHSRPVPGRQNSQSSTLDDLSAHPSPLPGSSGNNSTQSLTFLPTFEDKKVEKKDGGRKSSWKWILGNDEKSKEDPQTESSSSKTKSSKASKVTADKARLDLLQNSIDGNSTRGRESIVLNREDLQLEAERSKPKQKEKESGLLSAIFGGKKKSADGEGKEKKRKPERHYSPSPPPRILKPDIDYNWTRFSILEERAIYRMAHIKLANPRRALYSQVLLSNFMYSYLAKVQMMHPQIQIPAAQRAAQQRGQKSQEPQQQQAQQPPEYNQYQRWQEQQARQDSTESSPTESPTRSTFDTIHDNQSQGYEQAEQSNSVHDRQSSDEIGRTSYSAHSGSANGRINGANSAGGGNGSSNGRAGYSVSSTKDYLGYSKAEQPFEQSSGIDWDDDERSEGRW